MKKYFVPIFILLFSVNAFGANYYIRAGATGANNGSSWADAWTTFGAATLTRGNTYYVAGGVYNEDVVVNTAASAELWIIIKKANALDNGSDSGWNASYATNQAVIAGKMTVSGGRVRIDGVTGSGVSGHGIKIHPSTDVTVLYLFNNTGPYQLSHLDIEGSGFAFGSTGTDGLYYNVGLKNFQVSYCWIHEAPRNGVTIGSSVGTSYSDYGMLFENNVVERTGGVGIAYPNLHGQAMQIAYNSTDAYLIIRNNIFKNTVGTGVLVYLGGADANHSNSRIYNNIFYITDLSAYRTLSPGVIVTYQKADYFYIYNNTFYGIGNGGSVYGRIYLTSASTITTAEAKNNLWVNSYLPFGGYLIGITSASNNGFYNNNGSSNPGNTEPADPFVDLAGYDFRLKPTANSINSGIDLSGIVTIDKDGKPRPKGSAWDIGAYEYFPGPSNVRITVP